MATAYQRDQWRLIGSTDSGAESGSEEVATPANLEEPWKVRGTEYIYVPPGLCRSVNSDPAPLTNVQGRPQVTTACSRTGKEQYGGRCRYHAASINHASPNLIYARLCGNPYRFVVPSQRAPTPEEYHQLFGDERISFDAEGELLPGPEGRAPAPAPPRPPSPTELPPPRSLYDDSTREALENLAGSEDDPANALLAKASLMCNEALNETIALLGSVRDAQTTHNRALTETANALTEERRQGQRIQADLSALQASDLAQHPAHLQIRQEVSSLERSLVALRAARPVETPRRSFVKAITSPPGAEIGVEANILFGLETEELLKKQPVFIFPHIARGHVAMDEVGVLAHTMAQQSGEPFAPGAAMALLTFLRRRETTPAQAIEVLINSRDISLELEREATNLVSAEYEKAPDIQRISASLYRTAEGKEYDIFEHPTVLCLREQAQFISFLVASAQTMNNEGVPAKDLKNFLLMVVTGCQEVISLLVGSPRSVVMLKFLKMCRRWMNTNFQGANFARKIPIAVSPMKSVMQDLIDESISKSQKAQAKEIDSLKQRLLATEQTRFPDTAAVPDFRAPTRPPLGGFWLARPARGCATGE